MTMIVHSYHSYSIKALFMELSQMNENPDNTGENRDELGRFRPGFSGNPEGKPEGSISIMAILKRKLKEIPEGHSKTYLELLVDRILKMAIVDGDFQMIKQIWGYVDGLPPQKQELRHEGKMTLEEFLSEGIIKESKPDE